MKVLILLFILITGTMAFAYYDEDQCKTDPYVPCLGNQREIEARRQIREANSQRREQFLTGIIQQRYGGAVAWNDYHLAYVVCAGGQMNSCALGSPIDDCPQACASGTLVMCTTKVEITKKGIVDTIACSRSKPIRIVEPPEIVHR